MIVAINVTIVIVVPIGIIVIRVVVYLVGMLFLKAVREVDLKPRSQNIFEPPSPAFSKMHTWTPRHELLMPAKSFTRN